MRVVIRVDASLELGTGHVMRCLALAGRLRLRGATVSFICREHDGHLCNVIEQRGFTVGRLPASEGAGECESCNGRDGLGVAWQTDAAQSAAIIQTWGEAVDLLVVDHYALDEHWERALRARARRIFVLDDLADRRHACDLLLDQNLHDSPDSRYAKLVEGSTRVFVGPHYALLRPEFDSATPRTRNSGLRHLLAFFGGTDPSGETLKVVNAVRALGADAPACVVVLGPINPRADEIRQAAAGQPGVTVLGMTNEMSRLMSDADLGIGTCGGAAWERCVLGLPSLVVVNAPNQRDDARILHSLGAVRNLGDTSATNAAGWASEIRALRDDPQALSSMSQAAAAVMSGRKQAMQDLEAALLG